MLIPLSVSSEKEEIVTVHKQHVNEYDELSHVVEVDVVDQAVVLA